MPERVRYALGGVVATVFVALILVFLFILGVREVLLNIATWIGITGICGAWSYLATFEGVTKGIAEREPSRLIAGIIGIATLVAFVVAINRSPVALDGFKVISTYVGGIGAMTAILCVAVKALKK